MKNINLLCSSWGGILLNNLSNLREDAKMCDVKLVLQGGLVTSVHSSVMAAASPFFKSILDGAENPELNMEDFPKETIEQVIGFIYTGTVDIAEDDLYMLYTVAVDLNIQILQDTVKEVMISLKQYEPDSMDLPKPRHDIMESSQTITREGIEHNSNATVTQSNKTTVYPAYVKGDGDEEFVMFNESQNFGSCQKVIEIRSDTAPDVKRHRGRPRKNKHPEQHGVVLKTSTITPPYKGVFTKTAFPRSISFGPYNTVRVKKDRAKHRHPHNWMKFVQFAPTKEQQNLEAYESSGYVFFRTTKNVEADVELLLWCSEEDQEKLGISKTSDNDEKDALAFGSDTIYLPIGQVFPPPENRFDCNECDMAFISEVAFHKHMRQKHDKPLPLDIYLKIEKEKQMRKAEKDTSHEEDKNNKEVILNAIRRQHQNRWHKKDVKKPHVCPVCKKTFAKTITLKQHAVVHSKERPFKCKVCGKGFTQTGNLSTHMLIHTGEKPYKCERCGKGFAEASNFRRHWRTHTGDKPYLCFTCGKRFSQFCHLKSHTLKHTGERPFKCTVCSKSFCEKSSLAVHMKRHGEKIYLCPYCNKTFYTSCELLTHKKANHLT